MTAHLLQLSIGPVQEFIAAARRTRDLWFGSYLLSEVSRAIAVTVSQHGELIFPASSNATNVANIVLVELRPRENPAAIVSVAKNAAQQAWRAFADAVIGDQDIAVAVRRERSSEQGDIWAEQVGDVIEFYAAWVPLPTPADYKRARDRVMRLLNSRKLCRDFKPAVPHPGLPKSSLDGMRDTVLRGPAKGEDPQTYRNSWPEATHRKLRVRTGEQLDVIGVVKRAGEGTRPYPSVSRVAADPWVRGIARAGGRSTLDTLMEVCRNLDVVHCIDTRAFPQYRALPLEGTTLFRSRHHEWFEEMEGGPNHPNERREPPAWYAGVSAALRQVEQFAVANRLGAEPNPYLAVILADGDQVGKTLSNLETAKQHRDFSAVMAKFARRAEEVVQEHYGVLVYSGGDDVLAFVPVDQCLGCARKLHDDFGNLLAAYATADTKLTLSVGVAIGHFMENLEDLREYAKAAEKHAKTPDTNGVKDALAVHLRKRGGAPVMVRKRWADNLGERLGQYAGWFLDGAVSNRTPYELDRLAGLYDGWDPASPPQAIQRDAVRIIEKKRPGGETSQMAAIRTAIEGRVVDAAGLRGLAAELLIARQLEVALRQSGGGKKP
jgi:CRISPR-associated protein Cmr2